MRPGCGGLRRPLQGRTARTAARACAGAGGAQRQSAQDPPAARPQRPSAGSQSGPGGHDVVDQQDRQAGDGGQQARGLGAVAPPLAGGSARLVRPTAPTAQQVRAQHEREGARPAHCAQIPG